MTPENLPALIDSLRYRPVGTTAQQMREAADALRYLLDRVATLEAAAIEQTQRFMGVEARLQEAIRALRRVGCYDDADCVLTPAQIRELARAAIAEATKEQTR